MRVSRAVRTTARTTIRTKKSAGDLTSTTGTSSKAATQIPRFLLLLLFFLLCDCAWASRHDAQKDKDNLSRYIAHLQADSQVASATTPGSCWADAGRLASLSTDYKAAIIGDLITVVVADSLSSSNSGDVSTARTYNTSSSVTGLAGNPNLAALANLLGLQSAETLAGKSQADRSHSLTTTLAGRVVAVLPSGNLVIEAERAIDMNNEKQTITLRGLVRRGDIGPNNTVASNAIGDLELEVKGKGVISNGVRPPNFLVRAIMRIVNF